MWMGVLLHTCIVYRVSPLNGWPSDSSSSVVFDILFDYIHSFRMPLFFLIAGYFAHLLIAKRGVKYFFTQRKKRILYPFLLSMVIIVPISSIPFHYYRLGSEMNAEMFHTLFKKMFQWSGFYHIWFLYYLLIFYLVILLVLQFVNSSGIKYIRIKGDFVFLNLTLFLIAIQYFLFDSRVEPWTGIIPQIPQLLYYGFFFLIGFAIYSDNKFLTSNNNIRLIGGFFAGGIVIYTSLSDNLGYLGYSVLISLASMLLILAHIAFFIKYFQKENKFIRYLSDSAYWFYLIHLPIVVLIQVLLLNCPLSIWVKASLNIFVTTSIGLLSYHYLVRKTWIGLLLNGK